MSTKTILTVAAVGVVALLGYHYLSRRLFVSQGGGGSADAGAKGLGLKKSLAGSKAVAEAGKEAIRGGATKASEDESKKVKKV